jgi:DNA-binding beta-propeller fold protein YncE
MRKDDKNSGVSRRDFIKLAASAGAFALVGGAVPRVVWADEIKTFGIENLKGLVNPHDVALGGDALYVANSGTYGVVKLDGGTPEVLGKGPGETAGYLNFPMGVCAYAGGVIVADTNNNRVQMFDFTGDFYREIGRPGYIDGEFLRPKAVAVRANFLAVVDTRNHRVQLFDLKAERLDGQPLVSAIVGGLGDDPSQLKLPMDAAFDFGGLLYVVDKGHNAIKVYNTDGKFEREFGGDAGLNSPGGIAIAEDDSIFVADTGNKEIKLFSKQGEYKSTLKHKHNLQAPRGLALHNDTIFIADPGAGQVFVAEL